MPSDREAAMTLTKRFFGLLVCVLILGGGVGLVCTWTLGFSAFTSYSYALNKAGPLPVPRRISRSLINSAMSAASRRYGDAMCCCTSFTDPVSLSVRLSSSNCARSIPIFPAAQRSKLVILSISVDSVRDTTERLLDLWHEEGAFQGWIMAQPADRSIDQVAQEFGIWVFAKNDGTINHSADLFLIDPAGRIVRVISPQSNSDGIRRDLEKYL